MLESLLELLLVVLLEQRTHHVMIMMMHHDASASAQCPLPPGRPGRRRIASARASEDFKLMNLKNGLQPSLLATSNMRPLPVRQRATMTSSYEVYFR